MEHPVVSERLLTADTSGTSAVIGPGRAPRCREWTVYVHYGAGTSAGVYTVESTEDPAQTGTWKAVGTVPWTVANKTESLSFTGAFSALRVRNTTAVVGGSANVSIIGN